MKRLLTSMLVVGLLAQPGSVNAQQPYFYSGVPDAQEYLDFVSGSGVNGGYGVQVGPYAGRFTTPTTPLFSIYCVDYTHYARDQWVNVTGLADGADLDNTRLKDYADYQKAAYLASLFDEAPTTAWGGIHAAIWSLTSGVAVGDPTQRDYYLGLAAANGSTFSTAGWYVLSPLDPNGGAHDATGQEFLMRSVSVPEPASFLLIASGLLFLAAMSRKRLGLGASFGGARMRGLREGDA
ncbi:MAG: PEP-CTERM sorting domain-containing protein [Gemmatimonadales bacterium]